MSLKKIIKFLLGELYYNLYYRYQNNIGNRILLYHSIGTQLDFDTYGISISKEKFKEHLLFLKDNYEIIPIDNEYKYNLNRNTISLTFDDGFKDNMYVLELCEKYQIPFSIYITTGFIGKKNYLNIEDIKELSQSEFCMLGTHGVSHKKLDTLCYSEQFKELKNSKEILENIISKNIDQISFPHGHYNKDTLNILDELGYNIGLSSHIGLNSLDSLDLKRIKRIEIINEDSLSILNKKAQGYFDYLSLKERDELLR